MVKAGNTADTLPAFSDGSLADLVFDTLNVAAAALDNEGKYLALNDHWAELFRSSESDSFVGKSHFHMVQSFLSKSEFTTIKEGTHLLEQLASIDSDDAGEQILRWNAVPADDESIGCLVIVRRVERSREEMQQLARERDQLRFAVDGADYGLWDWNVVTGELYFSRQYMNMLGYEQFELAHSYETYKILCKPEDFIDYQSAVDDYEAKGDGFLEDEFQMICKDGSLIWVLSRGKIVSWLPDGSPLRIVGTHQNVDIQKAREEQLVIAKEEADKANLAKSDFLALISHEVRTPLNGITSVLELLGDEADSAERKRLSKIALNSSDQLLAVLSDVLDVSKMEAGRFDLHPKPVTLSDLIEELSQTHKKAIEAKGLKFSLATNSDPDLSLMMDPVRVTQILNNFLSNATKFTDQGEIAMSADVDETYGAGGKGKVFISFSIRDDGTGLTPSERRNLFQPFYQAGGTRGRSSEGTGLGLSICKKLAGLMGGKVWCASKKGYGSTFYFEAAFDRACADDEDNAEAITEGQELAATDIQILAAEDNPVNQMMLKKFLIERFGYQLTVVSDGQQAVDALEAKAFDIILMDIHMPVLDGVKASTKIRALKTQQADTPIIALTADAAAAHVEEYLSVGINACAAKPINWQDLDQLVKETVGIYRREKS